MQSPKIMSKFACVTIVCCFGSAFSGKHQTRGEQLIEFGDSLTACVEKPNAASYFITEHDNFVLPDVLPNTTRNSTAFTVGLFAGLGEFHPALCVTNFHGIHKGMVAGIWAQLLHYAKDPDADPDGVVFFGVLNLLLSEEFLAFLPTECQASREVIAELGRGFDAIKSADSHTLGNATLLALTSIEQSTRFKNALDLFRLGYPFCAGYQTSVALQRILAEPVLNKTSRNTSHRLSNAQKFTIGFLNGVTLAPLVDVQCVSSLRFTAPSLVEDLAKPSLRSLVNIEETLFNAIAECVPPELFLAMEGGHEDPSSQVLAALKNPRLVYDMMNEHPLEISANLVAMGLASKNGDWGRSGEEFGKMVGHLVNLTSIDPFHV